MLERILEVPVLGVVFALALLLAALAVFWLVVAVELTTRYGPRAGLGWTRRAFRAAIGR